MRIILNQLLWMFQVCVLFEQFHAVRSSSDIKAICGMPQVTRSRWRDRLSGETSSSYIIGGVTTNTIEFPWMVSLRRLTAEGKVSTHFCGGTIIAEKYVVTAAHCLEPSLESKNTPDTPVVVLYYTAEGRMAIKEIKKVHFHPQWKPTLMDADMAVIELKQEFDFEEEEKYLRPICLPTANDNIEKWYNCMAAGWGVLNFGDKVANKQLLKTDLKIVPRDKCRRSYTVMNVVTKRMLCAGDIDVGSKGTCQGDSGGPLMCLRNDRRYQLSGITSWGYKCGMSGFPAVFADVASMVSFIKDITGLEY